MKILVFNGSPKGEQSNTLQLTKAFCDGISQAKQVLVEIVPVYQKEIQDCRGCFHCWHSTPGTCCIQDDMSELIGKILEADFVVWSFPLYYFGLPSRLKALMDRLLPMNLPFMNRDAQSGGHPSRYDIAGKRYAVISTCGFYTSQDNYDAVNAQFDRIYGKDGYTAIFCGEGELFRVPELKRLTQVYLDKVCLAGREFAAGAITKQTQELLKQPLMPREAFEKLADADWGIQAAGRGQESSVLQHDVSLNFTRQMAALYNKATWNGKNRVVEFHYTDLGKTYQILLQKDGHQVLTENFLPYTTRIDTPLSLWQKIAAEEINGRQAMMEHQYTVQGDFELMLNWDGIFGVGSEAEPSAPGKKTNMSLMLAPWITIWVLLAIHPVLGGVAGILAVALLPLALLKWTPTVFEGITALVVAGISILSLYGISITQLLPLSYLLFGLMWMGTAFCRLPLSAYYSINSYRGEQEWENPLFIHTNRILTVCWGVLYVGTAVWTYFLMLTPFAPWTGFINSLFPALMGVFTAWFQKWYPAHYAAHGAS